MKKLFRERVKDILIEVKIHPLAWKAYFSQLFEVYYLATTADSLRYMTHKTNIFANLIQSLLLPKFGIHKS